MADETKVMTLEEAQAAYNAMIVQTNEIGAQLQKRALELQETRNRVQQQLDQAIVHWSQIEAEKEKAKRASRRPSRAKLKEAGK